LNEVESAHRKGAIITTEAISRNVFREIRVR
jgi:hypothetical protein